MTMSCNDHLYSLKEDRFPDDGSLGIDQQQVGHESIWREQDMAL